MFSTVKSGNSLAVAAAAAVGAVVAFGVLQFKTNKQNDDKYVLPKKITANDCLFLY
jgi:hypothetical protein